jgi:hypothetical protein
MGFRSRRYVTGDREAYRHGLVRSSRGLGGYVTGEAGMVQVVEHAWFRGGFGGRYRTIPDVTRLPSHVGYQAYSPPVRGELGNTGRGRVPGWAKAHGAPATPPRSGG